MSEINQHIKSLSANLDKLIRNFTALKNENEILKSQVDAQRKALADKNAKIDLLAHEFDMLKTAKEMSDHIQSDNHDDNQKTKELKNKMNALIDEIDQCISMLSYT